jgi:hypothetical protein
MFKVSRLNNFSDKTLLTTLAGLRFKQVKSRYIILLSGVLWLSACNKTLDFQSEQKKEFTKEEAKEWWYGVFKKTPQFKSFKSTSMFAQFKGNEIQSFPGAEKRYPSWNSATVKNIGKISVVELDLIQPYVSIPIPQKQGETYLDRKRIANSSLQKVLIFKLPGNKIVVRIVTLIPSLEYLKANNYFNKNNSCIEIPKDFSGIMMIRSWGEEEKGTWLIQNGKKIKLSLKQKETSNNDIITTFNAGCEPYWGVVEVDRWCIDVHIGSGDEPSGYCDNPENWQERVVEGWIFPDLPCGGDGYEEDECLYLTYEQCMCQTFGLECDGNGDDGGEHYENPPPPDPKPCDNANSLANNNEYKQKFAELKNKTSEKKEHGFIYKTNGSGTIDATPIIGEDGEAGIDFQVPDKIDGIMHSHYTGLLSVYSPDDLYAMAVLYVNDKMVNPKTFTVGVVTASGTQYIIMIDDLTKFHQFAHNIVNNTSLELFTYVFETIYRIKPGNDTSTNERAFLQYIQQNNSGLKLFKGDANFNNWQPKKVDESGNVVNNPC